MGVKISNLPAIVTPAMSDIFPVVQGGITYKETMTQLGVLLFDSPSIITPIIDQIDDANGMGMLTFSTTASAVNNLQLSNAATGSGPTLSARGSDSDIPIGYLAKGTSLHLFQTTGNVPISTLSGTAYQHRTNFTFSNTAATRNLTFPDYDGTAFLSSKANGTEAANAVTASGTCGVITTSSLTTASGASYAITWTNTFITTSSIIILSLMGGTNTKDTLQIKATAGSGTSTLTITNNNVAALDGTVLIGYVVIP